MPSGKGKVRLARRRELEDFSELRRLVKRWKKSKKFQHRNDVIAGKHIFREAK